MAQKRQLFGTDGVRGVANQSPMTSEIALRLGQAAAHTFLRRRDPHRGMVIGKDTRLSGYMLETALSSGICSMGGDVLLVGPLPTPGVAYIVRTMRADAGLMISASHNPYHDNGIKFFDEEGCKLGDQVEVDIESLMESTALDRNRPTAEGIGKATRIDDATGRYITFLKSTIPDGLTFDGMKVVVDCAHGAAYRVAPEVLAEMGAHVVAIGMNPDGKNINSGCGSLHPEYLCRVVQEQGADCGLALDGDADRVIMCDSDGNIVDGDAILAICAQDLHAQGRLRGGGVVGTTMTNLGLGLSLEPFGIQLARADVGDRYVTQAMREGGFCLGGEQSGHIIFADYSTTGDGTLAGLQILSIMQRAGKPLSELRQILQVVPQVLVRVPVREKRSMDQLPSIQLLVKKLEAELGTRGRILVRYSGTEPVARVMVEGEDQQKIRTMADSIAREITREVGS
jgi:phosphoglucosamine mutase